METHWRYISDEADLTREILDQLVKGVYLSDFDFKQETTESGFFPPNRTEPNFKNVSTEPNRTEFEHRTEFRHRTEPNRIFPWDWATNNSRFFLYQSWLQDFYIRMSVEVSLGEA